MTVPWKTFITGVLGTFLAGVSVGLFDAARVALGALEQGGWAEAVTGASGTLALVMAPSLLAGLWVGLTLLGLAGGQPYPALAQRAWRVLRVLDRAAETERLSGVLAALLAVSTWLVGSVLLFRAATARIVRPELAAWFTCSALLAWAVLVVAVVPALRMGLARVLVWRERLRPRRVGVVSLPGFAAAAVLAVASAAWAVRGEAEEFLYALDATPYVYAVAFFALALAWLALLATRRGAAALDHAGGRAPFVAVAGAALAALPLAVTALAGDMAAREQVFENSPAAAALFSALHRDGEQPPAEVAAAPPAVPEEPLPPPEGPRAGQPDIVVLSVDTVRADHVGAYGYTRHPTTPNLDAWSAAGTRFARAYSSGPCSSASFTGMISSQLPSRIGGVTRDGDVFTLPQHLVPLAAQMRAAGYRTRALLPVVPNYLKGIERGFDDFDRSFHYAESQADRALAALMDRPTDRPLFLWVHFVDPHFPYDAHAAFSSFGNATEDRYDQEIAFVDHHLGRVFQRLRESGALGHTVVAVFADHGEAFGEHGARLHGNTLHDEEIRVPFVVAGRGVRSQVVGAPVSLLDLGPTLLDLAGVPWRGGGRLGESLAAVLERGAAVPARRVLAEGCKPGTMLAVIDDRKLFYRKNGGRYFLYDLKQDPQERRNVFTNAVDAGEWVALVRREMNLPQ